MSPSIKKLISTFLLVAVLTSSFAWGASAFLRNRSEAALLAAAGKDGADVLRALQTAKGLRKIPGGGPDGENLTDSVADLFAQQLVGLNPEGPQSLEGGLVGLRVPTTTDLVSYLIGNPPEKTVLTPALDESRIKALEDFGPSDASKYLAAVANIQSEFVSERAWTDAEVLLNDAQGNGWAVASESAFMKARESLYALNTPAPLLPVHRSLLSFFSNAASFSGIMANDPVSAMGLFEEFGAVIDQSAAAIGNAAQEAQAALPEMLSGLPQDERTAWQKILGVQIAHATLPTIDYVHIATTIWEWLQYFWDRYEEQIKAYLTGLLKNLLLQKLSEKIVEWAGGGGAGGYVADWLSFVGNISVTVNDRTVNALSLGLCGNAATNGLYGEVLASAFRTQPQANSGGSPIDWTSVGDGPGCPPVAPGAVDGFPDGTFALDGFLNSLVNNPWNDAMKLSDAGAIAAMSQADAAKNEALAGQGYTSVKKCQDNSKSGVDGACEDGSTAQIVTPGANKKDLTSQSLTYIFDLITGTNNEDMKETLSQAVTAAVVTYVIKEGNGLFEPSSSPGGGPYVPPPPAADITGQLRQYASMLERALDDTNVAIDSYNQAIRFLQNALRTCDETTSAEIQDLIGGFGEVIPALQSQAQSIQGLLAIVNQFLQNPAAHTLAELQSRVGSFSSVSALAAQAAQDRLDASGATQDAADLVLECRPPA